MSILFFDPECPEPYAARTLCERGLGGSEATTIRIAETLDALVVQHNRTEADGRYLPPGGYAGIKHVVVLRDARPIAQLRKTFRHARFYLWVHDLIEAGLKSSRPLWENAHLLCEMEITIVCVSHYQRANVEASLERIPHRERIRTLTIYNPVDDQLVPDDLPVDPAKLIFFSSPSKGLDFTLDAFQALRRRMPDLRLQVGNPGYDHMRRVPIDGVESGHYPTPAFWPPYARLCVRSVRTASIRNLRTCFAEFEGCRDPGANTRYWCRGRSACRSGSGLASHQCAPSVSPACSASSET